jgi:hypothetical protein
MNPKKTQKRWKASELRKLPKVERDAILKAAAAKARNDYLKNPELTAFEAFGEDDLYRDSSNTQKRRNMASQ